MIIHDPAGMFLNWFVPAAGFTLLIGGTVGALITCAVLAWRNR